MSRRLMVMVLIGGIVWGAWPTWTAAAMLQCRKPNGQLVHRSDYCNPDEVGNQGQVSQSGEEEQCPYKYCNSSLVPLRKLAGKLYHVDVLLNNKEVMTFIIDTGASTCSIGQGHFEQLKRKGVVTAQDLKGKSTIVLADGGSVAVDLLAMRSVRVGKYTVHDVSCLVMPNEAPPLLGQMVLEKLGSWRIDTQAQQLVLY